MTGVPATTPGDGTDQMSNKTKGTLLAIAAVFLIVMYSANSPLLAIACVIGVVGWMKLRSAKKS